jgi:hypothetical protein
MELKRPVRVLLMVLGTVSVALGMLGVFLPVLPTVPFLLLAAVCYSRSSDRFYHWLTTNRWCGKYITSYLEHQGIPLKHKVITLALLWVTIGLTVWLAVSEWWARFVLLGIAVGVTIHVMKIRTCGRKTRSGPLLGGLDSPE